MTKLQKIGLSVSVVAAILWTIGLFVGWNYSFPQCDQPYGCVYGPDYHLIHFVLIVIFAVGIGVILAESSRKSLKMSCIISIMSVLLGRFFIGLASYSLLSSCVGDCSESEIPGHVFGILGLMFVVLLFVSLFFIIKHLSNSYKWSIVGVFIVVSLLGSLFIQSLLMHSGNMSLIRGLERFLNVMFLVFFIISIIVCIISGIKRYKEVKKSN